jgi:hypothetical protein
MNLNLEQERSYQAEVSLALAPIPAFLISNNLLASKLVSQGFSNVSVTGSGERRKVVATWSKPSTSMVLPAKYAPALVSFAALPVTYDPGTLPDTPTEGTPWLAIGAGIALGALVGWMLGWGEEA